MVPLICNPLGHTLLERSFREFGDFSTKSTVDISCRERAQHKIGSPPWVVGGVDGGKSKNKTKHTRRLMKNSASKEFLRKQMLGSCLRRRNEI
jgi:hypothetical protein